ncbi:HupE / UreJ protein [Fontimonas thermophila]|uniref:HupE / UreJ protein n=1 Tax=Fontimonas thermophila TaxID=1076937 RepID=A0A1I2H8J6_9GAMM|nr:HupE/UreJ family protein [Fontimonas thermophila]SFF26515.1 HupE / UreJ protein [Fontimonas thermophila]
MIRIALALLLLGLTTVVAAHPLAPALLELRETAPHQYAVLWRTSVVQVRGAAVTPQWPATCTATALSQALEPNDAFVQRWRLDCPGGLVGATLRIAGLERSGINAIVRIEPAHGAAVQTLLDAGRPAFVVPAPQAPPPVFARYLGLGIEHLLLGPDHLLFVLGLLLLVRGMRALFWTITSFTLGHSLTLSLTVLGFVRIHPAWTELAIAVSLLALACAIVRPAQAPSRWARWPWSMALGFGLVHGMGFAGALAEIGLPQRELPLALMAFNLGIELGQLAVVAVVLTLAHATRKLHLPTPAGLARLAAYAIGVPAAAWCYTRAAALLV